MIVEQYHALGNVYLVVEATAEFARAGSNAARILCDRHRGLGADGLLIYAPTRDLPFRVHILNPDGSLAEKSGNGLRIFARFLYDRGLVGHEPFSMATDVGPVTAEVLSSSMVRVDLGPPIFDYGRIPCSGSGDGVEHIEIAGRKLAINPVGLGNPHAVLFADIWSLQEVQALGPEIERHPLFPNRTNVQFARVHDPYHVAVLLWERGTGATPASGTSAAAVVAVGNRLQRLRSPVTVVMPGGALDVSHSPTGSLVLEGPVTRIGQTRVSPEIWESTPP